MSLYSTPKQNILDSTNAKNSTNLTVSDVTFGNPVVASADVLAATGKNTQVKLTGNGTTWSGSVTVSYNRLNLSDLTTLTSPTLAVAGVSTCYDVMRVLNYRYGMVLDTTDIVDGPVSLDANGAGSVTLVAATNSLGWIGSVTLNLVKGDQIIDYVVTDTSLSGINYPTGQSAKGQAPLVLYPYDFTPYRTLLSGIAVGTVMGLTDPATTLAQYISTVTGTTWSSVNNTTPGYKNIYGGKVIYNGANTADLSTNQAYDNVCFIQVADGSNNNGVGTTMWNTQLYGTLILHYNNA